LLYYEIPKKTSFTSLSPLGMPIGPSSDGIWNNCTLGEEMLRLASRQMLFPEFFTVPNLAFHRMSKGVSFGI
jgi:hypothetical protein